MYITKETNKMNQKNLLLLKKNNKKPSVINTPVYMFNSMELST